MYSKELLKGIIETIILKLLTETEMMYGYEITQKVKEITSHRIVISEGALYPTLHKLEALGWLTTKEVAYGKRVRKYYKLTKVGNKSANKKMVELTDFLDTVNNLLHVKYNGAWNT